MEALENIVKSEAFFPIILVLLVILLVLFCSFIISNKNQNNRRKKNKEAETNLVDEIKLLEEDTEVIDTAKVQEEVKVENLPVINIPIPKMDDTEVVIESTPVVNEAPQEQVVIEEVKQLVEEPVSADEIVNIEVTGPLDASLDVGEKVVLPVSTSAPIETGGEQVVIDEVKQVVENNVPAEEIINIDAPTEEIEVPLEKNTAFNAIPTADTSINENIEYTTPQEYTGEKTEVFDFPDFSELTGNEKEELPEIDVDEEIIRTANQYIASIMSR